MARRSIRIAWAIPLVLLAGSVRLHPVPPTPEARGVTAQPSPAPDPIGPAGRERLVTERRRYREEMGRRAVSCPQGQAHPRGDLATEG